MTADGMLGKQIAAVMGKSSNSIKQQHRRIRLLLRADSLYHAVAIALRKGLIS